MHFIFSINPQSLFSLEYVGLLYFQSSDWSSHWTHKSIEFLLKFSYNSFKYGYCLITRILVATSQIHYLWSDVEQQGSELETSLHIWTCYNIIVGLKLFFVSVILILIITDQLKFTILRLVAFKYHYLIKAMKLIKKKV